MNSVGGCLFWKTLDSNDQNQVADQLFSLKQWFAGGAQSRWLRKPGCGHCYLRFFVFFFLLKYYENHRSVEWARITESLPRPLSLNNLMKFLESERPQQWKITFSKFNSVFFGNRRKTCHKETRVEVSPRKFPPIPQNGDFLSSLIPIAKYSIYSNTTLKFQFQ